MAAPTGLQDTCFLVLAMFGRDATAADIRQFLRADGEDVTMRQIRIALNRLCREGRPRVKRASLGGGRGHLSWYRLSEHGRAVLAED